MTSTTVAQRRRTLQVLQCALDLATGGLGVFVLASALAGPGSSAPPQIEITAQARAQEPHGALTVRVASTGRPNGEPETLRRAKPHRRQRIDLVETDCRLGALD